MTAAAHNLSTHPRTLQPDLKADTIAIHRAAPIECYGYWRNGGQYDLTIKSYANSEDLSLKELAAALRAAFPGARIRATTRKVSVRPSLEMLAEFAAMEAAWQKAVA
jgi:hypothetical protein